jgi:hypothetical protein
LKLAIFSDVSTQLSKRTHCLIMIKFRYSLPSYD